MPQSDVPGEHTSPTQPFPTKPAPFARQSFTERDINPYLACGRAGSAAAKAPQLAQRRLVHAAELRGSIGMPGHNGGANWASSAVDPVNGELYIVSKNLPVMLRVEISDEEPSARSVNGPVVTREEAAATLATAKLRAAAAARRGALLRAVRLPAQPEQRHGRRWGRRCRSSRRTT